MSDYAREKLPYLKGAYQEANRINRYLRLLGLPVIKVEDPQPQAPGLKAAMRGQLEASKVKKRIVFEREHPGAGVDGRKIPNSLKSHRARLDGENARTQAARARIARMSVSDVGRHELQALMTAMLEDGYGAATIGLERALLRSFFNHARKHWNWAVPLTNPAAELNLPEVDNQRDRVMSADEWRRVGKFLREYQNRDVFPLACLLLESGMRASEPLLHAYDRTTFLVQRKTMVQQWADFLDELEAGRMPVQDGDNVLQFVRAPSHPARRA